MDTRPWQRSDAEYTVSAVLLAVIPGLLILLTIRWYGICLSPFVFLIALLSIIEIQRRIQVKTWKVVFIEQQIAAQVIENVLQNKNIPYQRVNDQFELEDSNLIIHIQYFTGHPPQHFIGIPSRPGDLKTPYT